MDWSSVAMEEAGVKRLTPQRFNDRYANYTEGKDPVPYLVVFTSNLDYPAESSEWWRERNAKLFKQLPELKHKIDHNHELDEIERLPFEFELYFVDTTTKEGEYLKESFDVRVSELPCLRLVHGDYVYH